MLQGGKAFVTLPFVIIIVGAPLAPMLHLHVWLGFAYRGGGHLSRRRGHGRSSFLAGRAWRTVPTIPRDLQMRTPED